MGEGQEFRVKMLKIAEIIGSNFFFHDMSLNEGENSFTLAAVDRAGNTSQKQFTIHRDSVKPVISITSPGANLLLGVKAITVQGSVTDANLQSVRVNGLDCQVSGNLSQSTYSK
jgi:bacillopeptidase F